jgi:uncharacterized protein
MIDYDSMIRSVKELLSTADAKPGYRYRSLFGHSLRVYEWARRLSEDIYEIDRDSLLIAALFHDVGYSFGEDNHAVSGVPLWREYSFDHDIDDETTKFVSYLISNHSKKELLQPRSTPLELVLLMEADLLDNTGAMSIVREALLESMSESWSYDSAYVRIKAVSGKILEHNPMVTARARDVWRDKQDLVREFIRQFGIDVSADVDR